MNWESIQWWRRIDHENQESVLVLSVTDGHRQEVLDAKLDELANLEDNSVFEWVEDVGQKVISTKWIITEKEQ